MNLYLIWQTENTDYDCYVQAVVAAETIERARAIHPDGSGRKLGEHAEFLAGYSWVADRSKVRAKLIGKADKSVKEGVVLARMNGFVEVEHEM